MGIFSSIMDKVFHHGQAPAAADPSSAVAAPAPEAPAPPGGCAAAAGRSAA